MDNLENKYQIVRSVIESWADGNTTVEPEDPNYTEAIQALEEIYKLAWLYRNTK